MGSVHSQIAAIYYVFFQLQKYRGLLRDGGGYLQIFFYTGVVDRA